MVQDMAVENQLPRVFSAALNSITWVAMGWMSTVNLRGENPRACSPAGKMPVQVHGVPHHGIVGQDDAYILPFLDHDPVRL